MARDWPIARLASWLTLIKRTKDTTLAILFGEGDSRRRIWDAASKQVNQEGGGPADWPIVLVDLSFWHWILNWSAFFFQKFLFVTFQNCERIPVGLLWYPSMSHFNLLKVEYGRSICAAPFSHDPHSGRDAGLTYLCVRGCAWCVYRWWETGRGPTHWEVEHLIPCLVVTW